MRKLTTMTTAVTEAIIDPVCGMNVPPGKKDQVAHYKGCSYYFCAEACRRAFEANPKNFLDIRSSNARPDFDFIPRG